MDEPTQQLFQIIYKKHNSGMGIDYKEDYIPTGVGIENGKFKVVFKNKVWLYYYKNGTWG